MPGWESELQGTPTAGAVSTEENWTGRGGSKVAADPLMTKTRAIKRQKLEQTCVLGGSHRRSTSLQESPPSSIQGHFRDITGFFFKCSN